MRERIDRREGRHLFGLDAEGYRAARPEYPEEIFRTLVEHGALGPGTATLEIGAGSGLATRRLIELGADPITVVEPDPGFAPMLRTLGGVASRSFHLVPCAFEDAELPSGAFDLVAAATSFHWLEPAVTLDRMAEVLRPGGFVALWWNVFSDPERDDPFHHATKSFLAPLAVSPFDEPDTVPYALDRDARETELSRSGKFESVVHAVTRWTLVLDPSQVGRLYGGFSNIQRLPADRRAEILRQLEEVARVEFGGRVERNMTSPLYLARRRAS